MENFQVKYADEPHWCTVVDHTAGAAVERFAKDNDGWEGAKIEVKGYGFYRLQAILTNYYVVKCPS